VLEHVAQGDRGLRLVGHEGAVEGGQPEPGEVIGLRPLGVEAERDVHLRAEAHERALAHAVHDAVHLASARMRRLRGQHDEDAGKSGWR